MKARSLLVAALTLGAAVSSVLFGQEAASVRLLRLTYMKVEQADISAYVNLLREHYARIHTARVPLGKLTSWKAYQVAFPNGEQPEYNFVLMFELPGYAQLAPDTSYAETARKTVGADRYAQVEANPLAKSLRTETLVLREATTSWPTATNHYLGLSFLRALPGKSADLMAIQRGHYLPATEDSVKAGRMTSWGVATVRFPEQRDYPYTHLSIAGYASLTQMEKEASAEEREKWRSRSTDAEAKLPTVRTRVKGELWRLVEQTTPRKP